MFVNAKSKFIKCGFNLELVSLVQVLELFTGQIFLEKIIGKMIPELRLLKMWAIKSSQVTITYIAHFTM